MITIGKKKAAPAGFSCTGYLKCQNFEGTGYDNSETWAEELATDGVVDEDDTTATILLGSQQLKITGPTSGSSMACTTFSAQDDIWIYFKLKTADGQFTANMSILSILDGSDNTIGYIQHRTPGTLRFYNGSVSGTSSTTFGDGSQGPYYIWFHWAKSTGSNGVATGYVNTSSTRDAAEVNVTNGDATAQAVKLCLTTSYTTQSNYYDRVLVKTSEITDVSDE